MSNFITRKNILLLAILLLAAYLRFYQMPQRATFLWDEAYDAFQVRNIIINHRLTLLGHPYSISGTYQGPLYYYLSLPFLWLSNFHPVGMAYMVAFSSLLAILVIFLVIEKIYDVRIAFLSIFFYSLSPLIIKFSRKSWYPSPIQLLAPLYFFALFQIVKTKKWPWHFLLGLLAGMALQFHILSFPLILIYIAAVRRRLKLKAILLYITGLVIGFLPTILFEFRHQFFNLRQLAKFINQDGPGFSLIRFINQFTLLWWRLFDELIGSNNQWLTGILIIITLPFLIKNRLLRLYWLTGLLGVSFYQGFIAIHYITFLHFVPFLALALSIRSLWQKRKWKPLVIGYCLLLSVLFISNNPLWQRRNYGLMEIERTSKIIALDSKNFNHWNVVDLTAGNTRALPYRYFLDLQKAKPMKVEEYPYNEILYAVSSDREEELMKRQEWEIVSGGPRVIEKDWEVGFGVKLYRLRYLHPSR